MVVRRDVKQELRDVRERGSTGWRATGRCVDGYDGGSETSRAE